MKSNVRRAALTGVAMLSLASCAKQGTANPALDTKLEQPGASDSAKAIFLDRSGNPETEGIRYHVLLEQKNGAPEEVAVDHPFVNGNRIWLQWESRKDAYVYVINRTVKGADKGIDLIRDEDVRKPPPAEERPRLVFKGKSVAANGQQKIPGEGAMRFDDQAGVEKLFIVIAHEPVPGLDAIFGEDGAVSPDANKLNDLDKRLTKWSKNTLSAAPRAGSAKGVEEDRNSYSVQRQTGEPMMVEISLKHGSL